MKSLLLATFAMNGFPFTSCEIFRDSGNLVENSTSDLSQHAQRNENFNDKVAIDVHFGLEGHTATPFSICDTVLVFRLRSFSCLMRILEKLSFFCVKNTQKTILITKTKRFMN